MMDKSINAVLWGTYDKNTSRIRILQKAAQQANIKLKVCHADIYGGIKDKSTAKIKSFIAFFLKACFAYPALIYRYMRLPAHDVLILTYPGIVDLLMIWIFARLRAVPVIYDIYIPLYEMIVEDRQLLKPNSISAKLLFFLEGKIIHLANIAILDTDAHARSYEETFNLKQDSVKTVFVGAESAFFYPLKNQQENNDIFTLFFFGQFIPLHGIKTIIESAQILRDEKIKFIIAGSGQDANKIDELIEKEDLSNIERIEWVPHKELVLYINKSDACLGIFGDTAKAARVIPNKNFQVIACQKPIITRDSPAMRELCNSSDHIRLIVANNAKKLAEEIINLRAYLKEHDDEFAYPVVDESLVAKQFKGVILELLSSREIINENI